jgi:hypothetical protein
MIEAIKQLDGMKVFIALDTGSRIIGVLTYFNESHVELTTHNNTYHIHPESVRTIREYKNGN